MNAPANGTNAPAKRRMPTLFIPHGGGPCFFMEPPPQSPELWDRMAQYLRGIAQSIDQSIHAKPRAMLVISAHWEMPQPTVMTSPSPSLSFDYHGFPEHTYRLRYPAAGSPALAQQVRDLLREAGIGSAEDAVRGFDHGVFVPLLLMYPQAEIPIVQLSLQAGLDPAVHLAIGQALAPLREQGVLIVGSGMSYHNLQHFFDNREAGNAAASAFDEWLADAVCDPDLDVRTQKLRDWSQAPGARAAHPREEHLLPLMVSAGAARGDRGVRDYSDKLIGKAISGFRFG